MKSANLIPLKPSGPIQDCYGIALPLLLILYFNMYCVLLIFCSIFFVKNEISCLVLVKKILLIVREEIRAHDGLESAESCCMIAQ